MTDEHIRQVIRDSSIVHLLMERVHGLEARVAKLEAKTNRRAVNPPTYCVGESIPDIFSSKSHT